MRLESIKPKAMKAYNKLSKNKQWVDKNNSFHLVGHSIGGLVARAFVHIHNCHQRVNSIITIGTPHRRTFVANI